MATSKGNFAKGITEQVVLGDNGFKINGVWSLDAIQDSNGTVNYTIHGYAPDTNQAQEIINFVNNQSIGLTSQVSI